MKSFELSRLLLLLFLVQWDPVNGLCSLSKTTAAECHDLEDARYIDTYHLHALRAASSSKTLTPGNFRNLTSLRHLDLSGGKIERIESGSFAKLGALQSLNLADNRISELEDGAFDGLKQVHSLKLGNNALKQIPPALMNLKELRLLDISGNPLNCNCANMKLRDALLARGVKISKKTQCSEPVSSQNSSILKPDTKTTCVFEKQDLEMQGDQPTIEGAEGSGEAEEDDALEEADKDVMYDEKEVEPQTSNYENNEETEAPPTPPEISSSPPTTSSRTDEVVTIEAVPSSTDASKDDITFDDSEGSLKKETTTEGLVDQAEKTKESEEPATPEVSDNSNKSDDIIVPVAVPKESSVTDDVSESPKSAKTDDIIVPYEGSGEAEDDGSGAEGSGMIASMPGIDFNETRIGAEEADDQTSSTSTTSTTEGTGWWGFGDIINNFNPWGSSETTEAPRTTTQKSTEDDLKEEQFIQVTNKPSIEIFQKSSKIVEENLSKQSPRTDTSPNGDLEDNSMDSAFSQESKKGMGSYIVLAILLGILAALISIAAYKADFCRKKRKRRDVEKGTELKDMQKSLLDQNPNQPKIQVANGNTLENVPLMNSSALPEEPKDHQNSYDITPAVITNGSSRPNGSTLDINDPIKPPRKSLNQEIEAPLNGLNPPMEAIDAYDGPTRTSLHGESGDVVDNGNCGDMSPLSPEAQRVKITLQENPDSVPRTPILITRLKGGENLVKAP